MKKIFFFSSLYLQRSVEAGDSEQQPEELLERAGDGAGEVEGGRTPGPETGADDGSQQPASQTQAGAPDRSDRADPSSLSERSDIRTDRLQ